MTTNATRDARALKIALRALREIADGREVSRDGHTEIIDRDDAAAIAQAAVDEIATLEARDEADHADRIVLQEIADGAYGDNPAVRGAARDRLKQHGRH